MHDLLQDIWLPQSAWIFISSYKHPKQAKIVLSPRLFNTMITVLTSDLKENFSVNGFDAPRLSTRKTHIDAWALSTRIFSGNKQVSDVQLRNNIL